MYFLIEYNPYHWAAKGPVYRVIGAYRSKWIAKLVKWYELRIAADPVWLGSFPYITIEHIEMHKIKDKLFSEFSKKMGNHLSEIGVEMPKKGVDY